MPDDIRLIRENEVVRPSEMLAIADAMIQVPADWTDWKFLGSAELGLSAAGMEEICIDLRIGQWRQFAQDEMSARGPPGSGGGMAGVGTWSFPTGTPRI
ncbi:MAG: hypothetical protein HYY24_00990 [Verrucomicrobia bacterium]|nr:hypothetical protein [Verrucomicrobiota bacterium]